VTTPSSCFLSSADLPAEKIADFSRFFKKYYDGKDKKLTQAVKITQQILLGNTTLEGGSKLK
jgi:hypothetical protein